MIVIVAAMCVIVAAAGLIVALVASSQRELPHARLRPFVRLAERLGMRQRQETGTLTSMIATHQRSTAQQD